MGYIGKVPADVLIDPHVDSAAITDGTIITADIADDAITSAKLATNSVDSPELVDGSVNNSHLAGSIAVSKTLLSGGTGLTLSGNTLNVDAAQSQITSVGTLTSLTTSGQLRVGGAGSGSSENLLVTSATSSDHTRVHIEKTTNAGTAGVSMKSKDSGTWTMYVQDANSGSLYFHDGSDNVLTLGTDNSATFAGKLGVGTSSVGASCNAEFRNSSGYTLRLSRNVQDANSGENFGSIQFSNNNDATGAIIQGKAAGNWSTNNYPTDIIFYTAQTSDVYERLRIRNDGQSIFAGGVHIQANEPTLNFKDLNHSTNSYSMINCNSSSASMEIQADVSGNYDNTAISFHIDNSEEVLKMQRANSSSATESTFGTTSDNNNLRIHGNLRMNAANSISFQNASANETVSLWNGGSSNETVLYTNGGIELQGTTNSQTSGKGRGQILATGNTALSASTSWTSVRTLIGDYASGILIFHVQDTGNAANTRCQIYAFNADYYERGVNSIDNVTGGVAPGGIEVRIVRDDGSTTSDGGGPYTIQCRPANGTSSLGVRLLILSAGT